MKVSCLNRRGFLFFSACQLVQCLRPNPSHLGGLADLLEPQYHYFAAGCSARPLAVSRQAALFGGAGRFVVKIAGVFCGTCGGENLCPFASILVLNRSTRFPVTPKMAREAESADTLRTCMAGLCVGIAQLDFTIGALGGGRVWTRVTCRIHQPANFNDRALH
jgi:hypothetical protein